MIVGVGSVRHVNLRLDEELYELIRNYAETRNITFSQAVREVIKNYFRGYEGDLDSYVVAKIIASEELFYNAVKAKLLVDVRARVILREILREFES
ncbi:MAG: hypothetical protein DRJ98_08510 [Thermoprotei archaeon]|nr:MAG: hypothetical protein DRJ98_08510 [Thermoprotei archaeon]